LNPLPPSNYFHTLAWAYFLSDKYEEGIEAARQAVRIQPKNVIARRVLVVCYAMAGREEEARAQASEVLRLDPDFSVSEQKLRVGSSIKNKNQAKKYYDALRKAGLPETPSLPLPDKPSIAVLPFVNMSGDPEQEYFGDGIAEEIITALSKVPDLFVIARDSSFTYKGKSVLIPKVSRELGVRYLLEGSVRKAGTEVRITARLVDAKTGNHLWAERYDRDLRDIFPLYDEITMKILTALQVKLTIGEEARLHAKGTQNIEAYLKVVQGRDQFYHMNKETNVRARQLFGEAIALDSDFGMAYRFLSLTHLLDVWIQATKSPKESFDRAFEMAEKAIELDDSMADAHAYLGYLYVYRRQHDKAIEKTEQAVALAPNSDTAHYYLGISLFFAGRHEESIVYFKKAIRFNPIPRGRYYLFLGHALCHAGKYEEAIEPLKKVLRSKPNNEFARRRLAICYILLGRDEEARAQVAEVLKINPKFSLKRLEKTFPFKHKADTEHIINALSKAGMK
jgi:TolB-like protein/Flp pilus assembly protein TadD